MRTLIPTPLTALIGRDAETASIQALLNRADVRLLTLCGMGGIGKTRLALHAAALAADRFAEGCVFVNLAPINDSNLLISTIAQALGVREQGDRPLLDSLIAYVNTRHLLLVLDNFERLLAAARMLVEILSACPNLKLLVTSRSVLHVSGEHIFNVSQLALPDRSIHSTTEELSQYSAVQLFVTRAQAAHASFQLAEENSAAVTAICQQLNGLPLAIELAAARVALLPPQALLVRLEHRLTLLTGGVHDLPVRLQTLRNAIEWSHQLLSHDEQLLFRRLAVFAGEFTLEAVEMMNSMLGGEASDSLTGVGSLVDQSLLQPIDRLVDEARFTMLDTLREYALEQLAASGEEVAVRRAHARCYQKLTEEAEAGFRGGEQQRWRNRLEEEINNLREALTWTTGNQVEAQDANLGLQIAGALWYFWFRRGFLTEGSRWLAKALVMAPDRGAIRARALLGAGALAWQQGNYAAASTQLDESLAIWRTLNDHSGLAETFHILGHVHFDQRDYTTARRLFEESHSIFVDLGDNTGSVPLLGDLGMVAYHVGDYDTAKKLLTQSLELARLHNLSDRVADALIRLGDLARLEADIDRATVLYEESLAICRELHAMPGVASALHKLGQIQHLKGDTTRAQALFLESLAQQRELGNKQGIAECLAGISGIIAEVESAVCLLSASAALLETIGAPLAPADQQVFERDVSMLRNRLGEGAWSTAWARGRAMRLEEAIALAILSQTSPSHLPLLISKVLADSAKQPVHLSPREREVVALIASGSSNREIAAALTITEKTAANHIEHIMNKLDLRSRTQIAMWAVGHRIIQPPSK